MSGAPSVLVVGAEGFIGRRLLLACESWGWRASGLGKGQALPDTEFDVVIDCNGNSRRYWAIENPCQSLDVTVAALCKRLTSLRYKTYVYLSTIDVYGEQGRAGQKTSSEEASLSPEVVDTYGLHKILAEALVRHHAARMLIIRLGTAIGPGLRKNPVYDVLHDDPVRVTVDSTLSLVTVDYLARTLQALIAGGHTGIWNVTGSRSISIREMLDMVAKARNLDVSHFVWHENQIETCYDINMTKLAALGNVPDSQAMLSEYLAQWQDDSL